MTDRAQHLSAVGFSQLADEACYLGSLDGLASAF